ncbi:MAG: IS110 family transposase [Gammaproteobacteria bacterium]|nr:IS110 family transposase [Gammaproteobacteria bacterium]
MVSLHYEVSANMTTEDITLGIDISKKKFDVALFRSGKLKHKSFHNDKHGFEYLAKWLADHQATKAHVCMESSGVYGEDLAEFLYDSGFQVSIVNPARVKGYAQSELKRSKTDKQDAGLIARFCAAHRPEPWQPQAKEIRQLRDLVRRLEALNDMRQQELNRLEAAVGIVEEQLNRHISYLEKEIKETKALINQHIDNHPTLKNKKQLLESIPGIGEVTINVILSEFSDISQFRNAKALAAFICVAPRVRQSGTSLRERGMMSKMGRRALRKAFFMPALVAMRYNPSIIELNQRLTEAGKPKMAIVGASMRKLIHIIYGVLKNEVPYDANYA